MKWLDLDFKITMNNIFKKIPGYRILSDYWINKNIQTKLLEMKNIITKLRIQ